MRKAEAGDEAGLDANLANLDRTPSRPAAATCCPQAARNAALDGIRELIAEFSRIAKGILMLGERPLPVGGSKPSPSASASPRC